DIAGGLAVVGSGGALLVRRWTGGKRNLIDGRAGGLESDRLGGAAVALQAVGVELGIGVGEVRATCEAAIPIDIGQVVPSVGDGRAGAVPAAGIVGDDVAGEGHRAQGARGDGAAAVAAEEGGRVAVKGTVGDGHRALEVLDGPALTPGRVVREGAVGDR